MTYSEALEKVRDGQEMMREAWEPSSDTNFIFFSRVGFVVQHFWGDTTWPYEPSEDDQAATDWKEWHFDENNW